ncbi:Glutamate receptor ionotropic, kainate 4 [Amphibalanus amphitrite]|uniref:Glutamate receptor ionotropic, kainate 4 n=1 Tax=Amphibalanus amphitrite TaxID=1232801 RepID=A0A6A4WW43_AMPAM|nr:Glutamate receptor ionotropic, kainate 4 [Amphibalanus amphitrite]
MWRTVVVALLVVLPLVGAHGNSLLEAGDVSDPARRAQRQAELVHGLVTAGLLHHQPLTLVTGSGGDGMTLSSVLHWQLDVTIHHCAPCDNATLYRVLVTPKDGLKLVVGDLADFDQLGAVKPHHWIGGEVVLLPAPAVRCRRLFQLPLLSKAALPLCVEVPSVGAGAITVHQRGYDGSVRSEPASRLLSGEPHSLLDRNSYHGRPFEAYFVDFKPYFVCGDAVQKAGALCQRPLPGPDALILETFAARVNLTLRFRRSPDGGWGQIVDGTWTGNVGEVWRGRADAAVAGLFVNGERAAATQFSAHTFLEEVALVSGRVPLGQQVSLGGLLPPVSWAVVAGLGLLVALGGTVMSRPDPAAAGRQLLRQVEDAFRGLWAQPVTRLPADTPRRLLVGVWSAACIVLSTALVTGLAAKLTAPRVYWSPMTLWDAVEHDYQVVTHAEYGAYDAAMLAPQGPLFDGLRARWVKGNNLRTMYRMLDPSDRVCLLEEVQYYITLRHRLIIETEGRVHPESIRLADQRAFTFLVGFSMQRNTPLLGRLNALISRLHAAGLIQHWMRLMRRTDELRVTAALQRAQRPPRVSALPLSRLRATVELLVTGWALAAAAFGLELLVHSCLGRRRGEKPLPQSGHN